MAPMPMRTLVVRKLGLETERPQMSVFRVARLLEHRSQSQSIAVLPESFQIHLGVMTTPRKM